MFDGSKWVVMDIAKVYPRGTRQGVYADMYILVDVNEAGYAVGSFRRYGLTGSSAILITPPYNTIKSAADVTFLSIPAGGFANAINGRGLIVGTTGNASQSGIVSSAFLYDGGAVTILGVLPGGLRSGATDINDFDQVVGYSESASGNHAFVWDGSNDMRDLNNLVGNAGGWVLISATAINDAGEIVGTGLLNGEAHGFLLTSGVQPPPPSDNQPPTAVAAADPSINITTRTNVNFDGSGSDDDGYIVSYSWDFGDGSSSSEVNPSHRFTKKGAYLVVLTVTDDGGLTATDEVPITVSKATGK